ncbi:MAG TPA: LytR C-terminal domain-containing protein [Thermoleophilaceae bacterium]|nr:LytR C-terminal domain-containing protein [Thermoleophilaceae bacterium]
MEIIQEIGSYAGFAAVIGLAVLAALYFSQARDVKRLREWAGRAPDRPAVTSPGQRVVARPMAKPAQPPAGGATPPPVPRPPGATTPAPAQAAATGAAPAVAKGPAPATPAAGAVPAGKSDAEGDAQDTAIHPSPEPREGDEHEGGATGDEQAVDVHAQEPAIGAESNGDGESEIDDEASVATAGEQESYAAEGDEDDSHTGEGDALPENEGGETGEWSPEDEHSELGFTDEHEAVPAATPAATAPRPPQPPRPFPRRATPAAGSSYARGDRGPILPPYEQSRPEPEPGSSASSAGRRTVLVAITALVVLALGVFAALQLTGGDDPGSSGDGGGLSAADPGGDSGDGGSQQPAIDPSQVTVAVLNGTTVPGLAATIGDTISSAGFQLGTVTNNFDQERAESVVFYAPGAEREAAAVGRRLDISQREAIDAESQALAGDATVVVVAGADQNQ